MAAGGAAEILERARVAFRELRYDDAEKLCKEALTAADKGMSGNDAKRMRAEIFSMLADIKNLKGAWIDSMFYQDSVTRTWFELGNNKKGTESLIKAAMTLTRKGKQVEALAAFKKAQEISRKHGNQPLLGRALFGTGSVCWRQGKYGEAFQMAEQAANIGKKEVDYELLGLALGLLAVVRSDQGEYKESIAKYKLAIEALEKTDNHYDLARNLSNLGETYMTQNDFKEAIKVLDKARKIAEQHQNKRTLGHILNNLAVCHVKSGDAEAAKKFATLSGQALENVEDKYAKANLQTAWGIIHASQGEHAKSEGCFEKGTQMMMELGIPYDTGVVLLEHGRVLIKQEKTEEAKSVIRLAIGAFDEAGAKAMRLMAENELKSIK
ncbi:MAG: tetratricopeptide repeat protein [Methanobacteriota archaeon]